MLGSALAVPAGWAQGVDADAAAISKLAHTGEASCEPALPYFCANIHVTCSGPTSIKTFPFKLRAKVSQGWIESSADTSGIREAYENGSAEWSGEGLYVILRPHEGHGYIKMLANGTYSFRHYSQGTASMSRGHCR